MSEIIIDKYELDLSGFEENLSKVIAGYDALNQQTKSAAKGNPFKQQAEDVLKFNTQLRSGSQLLTAMAQNEKALQAEVKRLATEYLKAAAAQQKADSPLDLKKSQEEIKKLRGEIDALTKQIDKANDQLDKLSKKRKTEPDKKTGGSVLSKVSGTFGDLAAGAGLALGGAEVIRRAVTDSAEYGKKLSELSALTGAAGKDLAFLDQQAQAIEQDTGVVASTILDTFKAVGSIQPALLSNNQALAYTTKEVVALAQAGSITLPEAAQATLGALNQFGEGADQAGRFVNVLAAGALKGASEISDTTQALKDSGTAMKAAGLSFEQGNALIQSLAGVMIKGSEAGTGLRNVLLKLETDTDKNLRPSIVGLDKALENAAKKYDTTTELTKVFGTENILVARRVLDTRTEIAGLTKELTGTEVAYEQQKINLNNLATDLDKAGSATTGFFRTLGQSQDGLLRRLTQGYTLFLQNLTNAKSTARTFLDSFIGNDSGDGIGEALITAVKDASRQSDANEVIRKRNAEMAGIQKAAQQQVAGETQDLVNLYTKQGEELPKAQRLAADRIAKQQAEQLKDAQAAHLKLRQELESSGSNKRPGIDADFAQSRKNILAAQTAKTKADSEVARLESADATRAKALKSLQGEEPTDKEKTAQKAARKLAEDNRLSLIEGKKKMQEELQKLEDQYDKQRLDSLDKDSTEYLDLKRKIDLKELEEYRTHLIEMGQQRTGHKVLNTSTGGTTEVLNKDYKLPQADEALLKAQKERIESAAQTSAFEASEANSRAQFERQQFLEKTTRERMQNETELDLRRALLAKDQELVQQAGESEIDYENRKAKALLQIRIDYYSKLLKLAKDDPTQKGQVQGLEEQLHEAQRGIDAIDKKGKSGPRDLFDLLGIKLTDASGKPLTDEAQRQVTEAANSVVNAANQALDQQIQNDQARIQSIDAMLQAKQNEVQVEATLAAAGLANNLSIKKQEEAGLQAERRKAVEAQRRDQAIQIGLNTLLQESQLALALAKIIDNAASFGPLFPFIVGAEIAAMFTVFASGITQIASLPKYHTGDEVTPETARKRVIRGDRKPDEVDARLQVGEGVIRRKSYQPNKRLFGYLNTLERPVVLDDLAGYVRGNPWEMAEGKQQQGLQQINQYYELKAQAASPDRELHKRVDELNNHVQSLIDETRRGNRSKTMPLPDGRVRVEDEHGNVSIIRYM